MPDEDRGAEMESVAHADGLAQEFRRHLPLDAQAVAGQFLAFGETEDLGRDEAVARIPDTEAAHRHLAGHLPVIVELDGEPPVFDVRDPAFAVRLPLVVDGQAFKGESGGACDGNGLHPAVACQGRALCLDRDAFAAFEVQPLDIREVRCEHLFLRVAAEFAGEDIFFELLGFRVGDLIDSGGDQQGGAGVLPAVSGGFTQGFGVILPVIGFGAETGSGDGLARRGGQGGRS